jgi:hypothetical protein
VPKSPYPLLTQRLLKKAMLASFLNGRQCDFEQDLSVKGRRSGYVVSKRPKGRRRQRGG